MSGDIPVVTMRRWSVNIFAEPLRSIDKNRHNLIWVPVIWKPVSIASVHSKLKKAPLWLREKNGSLTASELAATRDAERDLAAGKAGKDFDSNSSAGLWAYALFIVCVTN